MTPVKQTKLHSNEIKGNCLAAALASLLNRSLTEIPAFEENPQDWWPGDVLDWLTEEGYEVEVWSADLTPPGYVMAMGMSPRGIFHSVIFKDGELIHDPHPSNAGLLNVQTYWQLIPRVRL